MARRPGTRWHGAAHAAWRVLALACLACALLFAHTPGAGALTAITVDTEADRVEITALGEAYEGRGDTLQIETAAGADGARGRMSVRALRRRYGWSRVRLLRFDFGSALYSGRYPIQL